MRRLIFFFLFCVILNEVTAFHAVQSGLIFRKALQRLMKEKSDRNKETFINPQEKLEMLKMVIKMNCLLNPDVDNRECGSPKNNFTGHRFFTLVG